jgi:hypothetical protein
MASPDVSTNWKNNLASLEKRLNLLPAEARRRKGEIWTKGQDKQDRHLIRWIKKYIVSFFLASLAPWREKKGWTSIEQASGNSYPLPRLATGDAGAGTGRFIRLLPAFYPPQADWRVGVNGLSPARGMRGQALAFYVRLGRI